MNRVELQISKLFRRLRGSYGPRSLLAILCVLLIGLVGWLPRWNNDQQFVYQEFEEDQIGRLKITLDRAALDSYTIDGTKLCIPLSEVDQYYQVIDEAGISRRERSVMTEVVSSSNIFQPRIQQAAKIQHAIEIETEKELMRFEKIVQATVRFSESRETGGLRPNIKKTANVSVQCRKGYKLEGNLVHKIRLVVSGKDVRVPVDQITVTDPASEIVFPAGLSTVPDFERQQQKDRQQSFEKFWSTRIKNALEFVSDAKVSVFSRAETFADPRDEAAGTMAKITVLVQVPKSHYVRLWKSNELTNHGKVPTTEQLRQLQDQVKQKIQSNIHTVCATSNVHPTVTVEPYTDLTTYASTGYSRLSNSTGLWIVVVFLASGALFAGLHWRTRPNHAHAPTSSDVSESSAPAAQEELPAEPGSSDATAEQLRERLSDSVRRDPDSAAKILQTWMRQAG